MNGLQALFLILAVVVVIIIVAVVQETRDWRKERQRPPLKMIGAYWTRPGDGGFSDLPPGAARFIAENVKCPYCHYPLYGGPSGGMSQNFFCSNIIGCNSRFNVGPADLDWGQFTGECPPDFIRYVREVKHDQGTGQA